jgi:hypothetical protein
VIAPTRTRFGPQRRANRRQAIDLMIVSANVLMVDFLFAQSG